MKFYIFFLLLNLVSLKSKSQEFRFYFNGSNIEDSTFTEIREGDLLRIIFFNKKTNYKFKIAQISIILTPMQTVDEGVNLIRDTTEFNIINPSEVYTASPAFTLDLVKELKILKYNNCHISFKIKQLLSDTEEGSEWLQKNMQFKQVSFNRKIVSGETSFQTEAINNSPLATIIID